MFEKSHGGRKNKILGKTKYLLKSRKETLTEETIFVRQRGYKVRSKACTGEVDVIKRWRKDFSGRQGSWRVNVCRCVVELGSSKALISAKETSELGLHHSLASGTVRECPPAFAGLFLWIAQSDKSILLWTLFLKLSGHLWCQKHFKNWFLFPQQFTLLSRESPVK